MLNKRVLHRNWLLFLFVDFGTDILSESDYEFGQTAVPINLDRTAPYSMRIGIVILNYCAKLVQKHFVDIIYLFLAQNDYRFLKIFND